MGFDWQNNDSSRALHVQHALFVHSFAVTERLRREPNFAFCGWREQKTTTFFLFFLNFDTIFKNSTPEKMAKLDELNEME